MSRTDKIEPATKPTARSARLVRAAWDEDAKVWWAESDDIPGLVSEAATFDQLLENIEALIPDLLELNDTPDGDVAVEVVANRKLTLRHHAA